ncbi:MAG: HisA/HisF-related TIM barrel protein [Candidatus Binataceae bacterium]
MFERFTVIPSIDLKGGEVVRLVHGELSRATVYSRDPAAVARAFERDGAELIHVVDIDGAIAGAPRNLDSLRSIRAAVKCSLDVSGGLRTIADLRAVATAGADYIAIGTAAILSRTLLHDACREFDGRVFGSLDVRDGRVAIKGWVESTPGSPDDVLKEFRDAGVAAAIVTDISRDGTERGIDAGHAALTLRPPGLRVIVSGGVANLADIGLIGASFAHGVVGVIVGRSLYEGRFSLTAALALAKSL